MTAISDREEVKRERFQSLLERSDEAVRELGLGPGALPERNGAEQDGLE